MFVNGDDDGASVTGSRSQTNEIDWPDNVIAGRIGDPHRFTSLAAIRAYSGLVPKVSQSGVSKVESSITTAGDPLLREMLCAAADQARKVDPQMAAKYQRLMAGDRHHCSAICHLATIYLTRIATCMRNSERYVLRDVDGTVITEAGTDPQVAGLVYVAALAPDSGQSTGDQFAEIPAPPGFVIEREIPMIGGRRTYELVFEDCRVPGRQVLGQIGQGYAPMQLRLNVRRLQMGAR